MLGEKVGPDAGPRLRSDWLGVLVILRPTGEGMATVGGWRYWLPRLGYCSVRHHRAGAGAHRLHPGDGGLVPGDPSRRAPACWRAPEWMPMRASDAWTIAGVGVTGSLAQVALTEAFRRGEASLIAPLEYTALVWTVTLDLAAMGRAARQRDLVGRGDHRVQRLLPAAAREGPRRGRASLSARRPWTGRARPWWITVTMPRCSYP